jgi:hypothetical protein
MEVCGLLHAPAKEPPLPTAQEAGWSPVQSGCIDEVKYFCSRRESNLILRSYSPQPTHFTVRVTELKQEVKL